MTDNVNMTEKKKKKKTESNSNGLYKAINIVTTAIVILLVAFALLLAVPRFIGMDTYVVVSGSMEPVHKTGSLIYTTKNVDPAEIEVGDVITFQMSATTRATHRVVAVVEENGVPMFQTKGDANDAPDANLVPYEDVIGRALFSIPGMGYVANYIQNPPGLYFAAAFGVILIILVFISDMLIEDDSKTKKKKKSRKTKKGEAEDENKSEK